MGRHMGDLKKFNERVAALSEENGTLKPWVDADSDEGRFEQQQ